MSWGINPNATEKEKIFAEFNDSINGLNCADGLSYRHYSAIYDLGRKLADDEYNQGKADRDKELAEHCVFISNRPIEDIVLETISNERAKVLDEVVTILEDELYTFVDNDYCTSDGSLMWKCDEVRGVIGKLKEQK